MLSFSMATTSFGSSEHMARRDPSAEKLMSWIGTMDSISKRLSSNSASSVQTLCASFPKATATIPFVIATELIGSSSSCSHFVSSAWDDEIVFTVSDPQDSQPSELCDG